MRKNPANYHSSAAIVRLLFLLNYFFATCSFTLMISKEEPLLDIAEIIIYRSGSIVPRETLKFNLSSVDPVFFFPPSHCNNNNILDFCCASTLDEHPQLNVTTSKEIASFDKIVVYNRLTDMHLRNRLDGAKLDIFDDNNQLFWSAEFGNSSSLKYIFNVDMDNCLPSTSRRLIDNSCFSNSPEVVTHETFSQLGQDEFVIEFFGEMRGGVFVDFGANDGRSLSNSYALEKNFGWTGIAVEPLPRHYKSLMDSRNCTILNVCASNFTGFTKFRVVEPNETFEKNVGFDPNMLSGMVDTWIWQDSLNKQEFSHGYRTLDMFCVKTQDIFNHFDVNHIDYMSVDAEGAELSILHGIDWEQMDITLIHTDFTRNEIASFLISKGYRLLQLGHDVCAIKISKMAFK